MKLMDHIRSLTPYRFTLISINILIFIFVIYFIFTNTMFHYQDSSPQPNEIDLSGLWKISYEDNSDFASPSYDDSGWCLLQVPDNNIPKYELEKIVPKSCQRVGYQREFMKNKTYWYRKWMVFNKDLHFKDPSLFIGSIKRRGTVYWDGNQIGTTHYYQIPNILNLNSKEIKKGRHLLAVKVSTENEAYPGIYHGYTRKITIGEWDYSKKAIHSHIQEYYLLRLLPLLIQTVCFFIAFVIVFNVKSYGGKYFWQSFYFGFSSLYLLNLFNADVFTSELSQFLEIIFNQGIVCSLFSYSSLQINTNKDSNSNINLLTLNVLCLGILSSGISYVLLQKYTVSLHILNAQIFVGTTVTIFLLLKKVYQTDIKSIKNINIFTLFESIISLFIFVAYSYGKLLNGNVSIVLFQPTFVSLLSFALIFFGLKSYIENEKRLSFYGHFVRSGLKQWLNKMGGQFQVGSQKKFIGRKLPIIKIDIVDFSLTTDSMPYGARRIYQDIWYLTVDSVLTDKTLLDKGEGDGSIYYFTDENEKSCSQAVATALEIIERATREFDLKFRKELKSFLEVTPEMKAPMDEYVRTLRMKTGKEFWTMKTEVRAVFVYDYVDEGLWGAVEYSHYDFSGPPLVKLARLEKLAQANEFLMDEPFFQQWQSEGSIYISKFDIHNRQSQLKGLGLTSYHVLSLKDSKKENS